MRRCLVTGARGRAVRACAACATILGTAAAAEEPDFFVRLNRARDAVSSGAGKRYFDGAFSKAFYAQHPDRLGHCMKTTGEDEPTGFDLLLQLAKNGRVESALVNPESRVATCYRDLARNDVFPPPPAAGLWVPLSIRISEE